MTIGIIIGSPRPKSQSTRVGTYIAEQLAAAGQDTYTLDLRNNTLPLWNEEAYDPKSELSKLWQPYSEKLAACRGFVVISPEWGGMATPHIKNFFLYCSKGELAHKPGLIVSVSAGQHGAYPIGDLRAFSAKNVHLVHIPDHVIVRWVTQLNFDGTVGHESEPALLARMGHALRTLVTYSEALTSVRESGCVDLDTYPYGM